MNKFRAKKVVVDGITFDSIKESRHYLYLREMVRTGEISNLIVHPRYNLDVNGVKICDIVPDFEYEENGVTVTVDVKGMKTGTPYQLFRVKAKLFKALYGREVIVV